MKYRETLNSKNNQTNTISPYVFFIYFFDELTGHVPLFSYPNEFLTNERERQIISIHPAWWHQDKFLQSNKFTTIDLELEGIIYVSTMFLSKTYRTKKRVGMNSEKWKLERFILIIKAPSKVSFIIQEMLHELKDRIQEKIGDDLCFLVEKSFKSDRDANYHEYLAQKVKNVEETLSIICQSLIPKIPISKLEEQMDEKQQLPEISQESISSKEFQKLKFSIPSSRDTAIEPQRINHFLESRTRRVTIIKTEITNNLMKTLIRNESPIELKNVLFKVYKSKSFFGKSVQVWMIKNWAPNEEVSIKFEVDSKDSITYFLRIEDEEGLIKLIRILG